MNIPKIFDFVKHAFQFDVYMLLQCNMHRFPCQIRYLIFFFGDTLYRYTYIFYIGVFSRNLYVFFPIRPIENILMLWITNYIMRYIICASHAYRSLILQVPPLLLFVLALICEVHPGVRKLHYSYSPPRVRKLHYSYFTQGWAINLDWGTNTLEHCAPSVLPPWPNLEPSREWRPNNDVCRFTASISRTVTMMKTKKSSNKI